MIEVHDRELRLRGRCIAVLSRQPFTPRDAWYILATLPADIHRIVGAAIFRSDGTPTPAELARSIAMEARDAGIDTYAYEFPSEEAGEST